MDMINIFLYKYIYFYPTTCKLLSKRLSNVSFKLVLSKGWTEKMH